MLYSSTYCQEEISNICCINEKSEQAFHKASQIAFESHPEINVQIECSSNLRERASEEKSESKRWEGQVARFERYENEFIALRMELFGIAWVMRFGFGVSRILDHELGVRSALENNDRLEIWEVTDAYNRAVGEYVSTVVDDVHHKQKNCYSLRGVIPSTAHELEQKRHSIHQELLSFLTKSDNDPEFYQRCTESCNMRLGVLDSRKIGQK